MSLMGETEGSANKARPSCSKAGYCYLVVAVSILETISFIHLIEINRSDSAIHLSNNWGLINCNVDVRTESYARPSSDEEGQERNLLRANKNLYHIPVAVPHPITNNHKLTKSLQKSNFVN